jgi:hypothetical protein
MPYRFWGNARCGVACVWQQPWVQKQEKTSHLVLPVPVRDRFDELLAPRVNHGESDLLLPGRLSLIDAMTETPMAELLNKFHSTMRPRKCCWDSRANRVRYSS